MSVPTIRVWLTPGEGDIWMAFSGDLTRYVGVGDDADEALEWWWLDWTGEWMQDTTIRLTPVGEPEGYGVEVELYEGDLPGDDDGDAGDGRRYVVPHDESFEGREFLPAAQLESGAELLMLAHQDDFWHLKNTRIVYLWKRVGGKERGKYRLGAAVKLSGTAAHFAAEAARAEGDNHPPQILIWLAANAHFGATDRQIESTLYHELMHIVLDDDGEPALRGHDFEGFAREIEVYGLTTDDARYMAEAFYRQAPLFSRMKGDMWQFRQGEGTEA